MTEKVGLGDVLTHARGLIDEEGWIQGDWWAHGEGYCALGAVNEACNKLFKADIAGNESMRLTARETLNDHVMGILTEDDRVEGVICGVIEWNDADGRTKAQVLQMLDDVAGAHP